MEITDADNNYVFVDPTWEIMTGTNLNCFALSLPKFCCFSALVSLSKDILVLKSLVKRLVTSLAVFLVPQ